MRRLVSLILPILLSMLNGVGLQATAMPTENSVVQATLRHLDSELDRRAAYIQHRQLKIDSLRRLLDADPSDLSIAEKLGAFYTSFNNDSALVIYSQAFERAKASGNDSLARRFSISHASLLPLAGFISEAIAEYRGVDPDSLSATDRIHYFSNGRQMYSYISSYYHRFPKTAERYSSLALESQRQLLDLLPEGSDEKALNQGEYYFLTERHNLSYAILTDLVGRISEDDNMYARAHHMLADINRKRGSTSDVIYHLALSAISDTRGATREVTSLQELGQMMAEEDDMDRAHEYLYTAMRNAVECNAETRMIQVAEATPLIESVHQKELSASRQRIYIVIALMALTLLLLVIVLIVLRMKIRQMKTLQLHLQDANRTKEEYISQFLNLCSIYMDKLKQFCNVANRKISTGKVDDLYQLTKSGKFIENQSKEFYEIFDNAFIHIYPGFVDSVNSLLRPECRIELEPGELLNTDLRILAFMRLGISDTARIAQILNYSVNTIYTYRNKLKNRAISRDTFESDIQSI